MENDLTTKKGILRIYFRNLRVDNLQEYFENNLRSFYYSRSEKAETQSGENIPKGFDRFLNTLPTKKGDDQKPIVLKADLKTKKGFRIEERDFLEVELSKINKLCDGVDLINDLDLKKSVELYVKFLKVKLGERTKNEVTMQELVKSKIDAEIAEFNKSRILIDEDIKTIEIDMINVKSVKEKDDVKNRLHSVLSTVQDISKIQPFRNVHKFDDMSDKDLSIFIGRDWRFVQDYKLKWGNAYRLIIERVEDLIKRVDKGNDSNENKEVILKPQQSDKSITDYFKYNPNPNHITGYLEEIRSAIPLTKKITIGAVCLALYEKKMHRKDEINTFCKFVEVLTGYWQVEPPKDKHKNKYENEKNELKQRFAILERSL